MIGCAGYCGFIVALLSFARLPANALVLASFLPVLEYRYRWRRVFSRSRTPPSIHPSIHRTRCFPCGTHCSCNRRCGTRTANRKQVTVRAVNPSTSSALPFFHSVHPYFATPDVSKCFVEFDNCTDWNHMDMGPGCVRSCGRAGGRAWVRCCVAVCTQPCWFAHQSVIGVLLFLFMLLLLSRTCSCGFFLVS